MRVLKFGGTSVANAERFIRVSDILQSSSRQDQVSVVLSAPAKITNHLVAMINHTLNGSDIQPNIIDAEQIFSQLLDGLTTAQPNFNHVALRNLVKQEFFQLKQLLRDIALLKYCPDSINADIICRGEKLSISLMEALLLARGCSVTVIDPVQKLLAQGRYLESTVDITESTRRINDVTIPVDHIVLMAGFTAGNERGELVVLGRNGSDYSAAVLAACLRADCCEIWTDVDGVYTCDPHQVPDARLLSQLSYQEAMDLSYLGAKVLHPRAIIPIAQFQIPCFIKNTTNPQAPGTLIGPDSSREGNPVKGITYLNNMAMINVTGSGIKGLASITTRIFAAISLTSSSAVLLIQSRSEYRLSFCVSQYELTSICQALKDELASELKSGLLDSLNVIPFLAIISVVGDGMHTKCELSAKLFAAMARANIQIIAIAQGLSERFFSLVVDNKNSTTCVRLAHQILFDDQVIEVFMIGTGGYQQHVKQVN